MKNIFKFKIAFLAILGSLMFSSCLVDDDVVDFSNGPDLVGFSAGEITLTALTTGEEQDETIEISAIGPNIENKTGDINVSFSIDQNSTAVEGENYEFSGEQNVTLKAENDYTFLLPLTVLTAGIEAPQSVTLTLNIDEITSSENNILENEKSTSVDIVISYICPSDLAGTYYVNGDLPVNITETGTGQYEGDELGIGPAYGFTFSDICGELTLEGGDPGFSNVLTGTGGTVNDDGSFTLTGLDLSGFGAIGDVTFYPEPQ